MAAVPAQHVETPRSRYNRRPFWLSATQRQFEESSERLCPRFLFRGWHECSGGGDPGLNSTSGIVPHAFLRTDLVPTSIHHTSELKRRIEDHLLGVRPSHPYLSVFSSWAADIKTAVHFSGGRFLAIIDTTLLPDHVRVYHTVELKRAGFSSCSYEWEYLLYGPIFGPGYHCTNAESFGNMLAPYIEHRPTHLGQDVVVDGISGMEVCEAKKLARLMRGPNDPRPDVIVAMTAQLLCQNKRGWDEGDVDAAARLERDVGTIQAHLSEEMAELGSRRCGIAVGSWPAWGSTTAGLVNRQMRVSKLPPDVHYRVVRLTAAIEDWIRCNIHSKIVPRHLPQGREKKSMAQPVTVRDGAQYRAILRPRRAGV